MALKDSFLGSSPYLDYHMDFTTVWARGQWFIASSSYTVTSVQIYVRRFSGPAAPGTVTVAICEVSGNLPGAVLDSATFNGNDLSTSYSWQSINLSASLTNGIRYCITVIPTAWGLVWAGDNAPVYTGSTQWDNDGGPTWNSAETGSDQRFRVNGTDPVPSKATNPTPADTDTGVDFSGLVLDWDDGGGADTFDVYIGPVGALVKVADAIVPSTFTVDLEDVPTDQVIYWRVDSTNAGGTTEGDTWSFDARPVKAETPSPTDAVSDITLDETPLSWVDGGNADTYNVYFGESGSEELVAELQADLEWTIDFGTLAYNTTYGWRIDSVNDFGTTTGDTWTFDTIVFAPPVPGAAGGGGGGGGGGGEGEESSPTGENNMLTLRRLIAAAKNTLWYEDI